MRIHEIAEVARDPRTHLHSDKLVDSQAYVGIEIELEGMDFLTTPFDNPFMTMKDDGSLRNSGYEFITGTGHKGKIPLHGEDLITSLRIFDDYITEESTRAGKSPVCSKRTSVHVHLDVRELSVEELLKFVLLYSVFEPVLFRYAGPGRESSNYCKPISSLDEYRRVISEIIVMSTDASDTMYIIRDLLSKADKYTALNIKSILNLGTVEVRIHRGTYEYDKILKWVNILLQLRLSAMDPDIDLRTLPERVSGDGLENFLVSVFKEESASLLPFVNGEDTYSGVRIAQEMLHLHHVAEYNNAESRRKQGAKHKEGGLLKKYAIAHNRELFLDKD